MYFDYWFFLIALVAIIPMCFIALLAEDSPTSRSHGSSRDYMYSVASIALVFVLAINGVSAMIAANTYNSGASTHYVDISYAEAASQVYGIESGKPYELQIGARSGSAGGSVNTPTGISLFFGGPASVDTSLTPGSTVAMAHTKPDGKTIILEVPTEDVEFIVSDTDTPSVEIIVSNQNIPVKYPDKGFAQQSYQASNCRWIISNMLVWKRCNTESGPTNALASTIEDRGLGWLVTNGFDHVEVTLTHDQFNQLLGNL